MSQTETIPLTVGEVLPDFTLPDLDGHMHSLTEFRGKKLLVFMWASW